MKMKFILSKILKERGIPKLQLSKEIGVSYPTIDKLCKGETLSIKFYVLENICNALNCTPNDLFECTDIQIEIQQNDLKKQALRMETYENELRNFIKTEEFQNTIEALLQNVIDKNKKDDTE